MMRKDVSRYPRIIAARALDYLADRLAVRLQASATGEHVVEPLQATAHSETSLDHSVESVRLTENLAFRTGLELLINHSNINKNPNELFCGVTDDFWLWLNTEGYRRHPTLRKILPAMPDEDVQWTFTGNVGDTVLLDGFSQYTLFKELFETHVGPIADAGGILDFGCGWGRIIRFFIRDVDNSRLFGVDPLQEMIAICTQNRWCNFQLIDVRPPAPFQSNTFDLIYSVSVFSHFSEEMHRVWLAELRRILKPGGLLIATTRDREFIEYCAALRAREDLDSVPAGPMRSAASFMNTRQSLADYDSGKYCYTQLIREGSWSYWGDAAIPKEYVLKNWTQDLAFVDYIDDRRYSQNVIVMKNPAV
jgi:SAM-dependent methyltransferase